MQLTLADLFDAPPPVRPQPGADTDDTAATAARAKAHEQALAIARLDAHKAFNRHWNDRNRSVSRPRAFERMARDLRLTAEEADINRMDIFTCRRVMAWVAGL